MKRRITDHVRGAVYMADLVIAGCVLWQHFPQWSWLGFWLVIPTIAAIESAKNNS